MDLNQAIDIIKKPKNTSLIQQARNNESFINFLFSKTIDKERLPNYRDTFYSTVRNRINDSEAYNTFINNLTLPLASSEFTDSIYAELKRIFSGNNKYIEFGFEEEIDKENANSMGFIDIEWFKTIGYEWFKTNPNSVVIIDLPTELNKTGYPEPYYYVLTIDKIYDIDSKNNEIKYVCWVSNENETTKTWTFIDKYAYLVVNENKSYSSETGRYTELVNNKNTIDRIPAVWLCNKNVDNRNDIIKDFPVLSKLGDIQEYLIQKTFVNVTKNYFVPVIVEYKDQLICEYQQGDTYCDHGYLKQRSTISGNSDSDVWVVDNYTKKPKPCPLCNNKVTAGQNIKISPPRDKEDYDLAINRVTFKNPDPVFLKYTDESVKNFAEDIKNSVLGQFQTLNPAQQQNETRVIGNYEDRQLTLINWKTVFEKLIKDVHDIRLTIRYQSKYLGSAIDLGNQFFSITTSEVYAEKEQARKLGMDNVIDYDWQIISSKYANNEVEKKRGERTLLLARYMRPFNSENSTSVTDLYKSNKISDETYIKHIQFFDFISAFELENDKQITDYDFKNLIEKLNIFINKKLEEYGTNSDTTGKENSV